MHSPRTERARENTERRVRVVVRLAYVDYGFTWPSVGRRGRRGRVKETVSRTLLLASLCGRSGEAELVERVKKKRQEKKGGKGRDSTSLTRHEKRSLSQRWWWYGGGMVVVWWRWQGEEKKSAAHRARHAFAKFSRKTTGRNNGSAGIMPPR